MSYDKLLGNYTSAYININDFPFLIKNGETANLRALNEELAEILTTLDLYDKSVLKYIELTRDGYRFDLSNLKNVFCKYLNIEDDKNLIETLEKLEQDIKTGIIREPNLSEKMEEDFKKYRIRRYISSRTKKKKEAIIKKKEFLNKIRREIRTFIKLLKRESECIKVNDVFSDRKMSLYIAFRVMLHARKCEKNNENEKSEEAIDYLKKYIESNQDLVKSNYCIYLGESKAKRKIYRITDICDYLSSKKELKTDTSVITPHNYSFFECDSASGRKLLTTYTKNMEATEDSYELQLILRRKIALYDSIDFVKLKIGLESFSGYIGFQLDNGFIILDKLYDNARDGKIAEDNAIYIVRCEDFEKITRMTKSNAIEAINLGLINAKRIIHSGNYEGRVKQYIKSEQ